MKPPENAQLVCISNFPAATYSGMLPGVLAGQYDVEAMEIDLVRLCASAGARLIIGEVTEVDHVNQEIKFRDRPPLAFDVLSIGIGSRPTFSGVKVGDENPLVAVKPMQSFLERLKTKLAQISTQTKTPRIVIVGGGIGSIEIAFCLHKRLQDDPQSLGLGAEGANAELSLVTGGKRVGTGLLPSTQDKVLEQG